MPDSDKQSPRQEDVFDEFDASDFDYEFDDDFEEETDEEIEELEAAHEGDFLSPPFAPGTEEGTADESS